MWFIWQDKWVPKEEPGVSRRMFLGGLAAALAAPVVVRSGVLMPVRKLIVPEAPRLLVPTVATWLEASPDGKMWVKVRRMVGLSTSGMSPRLPPQYAGWQTRFVIDHRHAPLRLAA